MGGQGSGRKPSEETIVRRLTEPKFPIASQNTGEFFLPNLSGDHSAGKVLTTPTTETSIANKKYIDDAIAGLSTSHADLTNLNWANAGHTFDTNLVVSHTGENNLQVTSTNGSRVTMEMIKTGNPNTDWRFRNETNSFLYIDSSDNDGASWDARVSFSTVGIAIPSDTASIKFGAGADANIYFDGSDLLINSLNQTANDEVHITNFAGLDLGGGFLTNAGTITGTTLTDGTFSVTGGAITGASGSNSQWTNDEGYLDTLVGENISDLTNDSGYITSSLAADLDFNGYKAVAMACDNGTSFPSTPSTGQWFYRTDLYTLFFYESSWKPIISFGAFSLYVDPTDGEDSSGYGYAPLTAAQTLQYAWSLVPPLFGGDITIVIAADTVDEDVVLQGKNATGDYTITIQGTMTEDLDTTATGGTQGTTTGGTRGTVVKSSAGWTVNAYQNLVLRFKDDTTTTALQGREYIIESNTSDTIIIFGAFQGTPANGDTFEVLDWGTTVDESSGFSIDVKAVQKGVILKYLKFTGEIKIEGGSTVVLDTCNHSERIWVDQATIFMNSCYSSVDSSYNLQLTSLSWAELAYCYFYKAAAATSTKLIWLTGQSIIYIGHGTTINCVDKPANGWGVKVERNCMGTTVAGRLYTPYVGEAGGYPYVINCDKGIIVDYLSVYLTGSRVQYSNNNTNESATAANFSLIT